MKQVRPKKNLGQHFLTDLNIAKRIADTVDEPYSDLPVLEVGPGMGVMTQFLVEKPRPLKVVEIDRESVEYLKERFSWTVQDSRNGESKNDNSWNVECGMRNENSSAADNSPQGNLFPHSCVPPVANGKPITTFHIPQNSLEGNLIPHSCVPQVASGKPITTSHIPQNSLVGNLIPHSTFHIPQESHILSGDFLKMDLHTVFDGQPFVLTGNYPYDISSQIFFKMLDNKNLIPCCTGMIQHEVAVRMASQPGNKQYGILSVLIQAWYNVEYLFTVEPSVFNPPPKVQSAVIRMTRNEVTDLGCDEQLFKRIVKATFNQRRKMLRVSLRQIFDAAHPAPPSFFDDEMMTRRPEQLSIPEFVELTNKVSKSL